MDLSYEKEIIRYAEANANIALVKYWGKRDEAEKLPYNSSLSMTLDALHTRTAMVFIPEKKDVFILNGILQGEEETKKLFHFLKPFRERSGKRQSVYVNSYNNFPTAAGLASSASGYAAMAAAADDLFQTRLSDSELSRWTRRGSGSACRSLFGGFVVWNRGEAEADSYAQPFASADDYVMLILLIHKKQKKISSTGGMKRTVDTSIFYPAWVKQAEKDFAEMKRRIMEKDVEGIGELMEANCLRMHATTMGAAEPFTYFHAGTFEAMEDVRNLRREGLKAYFTVDAGPNVKIFCKKQDVDAILLKLQGKYSKEDILVAYAGKGVQIKECKNWKALP